MFRSVLFCCLILAALAVNFSSAMTAEQKDKIHAHFTELGMECMKDTPISEADIEAFRSHTMPTGDNVPCFLACMFRKIGLMDDKGMLQKEDVLEMAKKVFNDPEEIKNLENYLHTCSPVNNESVSDGEKGCERSVLAFKCMIDNLANFGFDV